MKNKKQLLSEEVKQLQKIAGIKTEDLGKGDISKFTNNQELSAVNSKIQKLYPGAVPAEDESDWIGTIDAAPLDDPEGTEEDFINIAVYDWPTNPEKGEEDDDDLFNSWTEKIIVAKSIDSGKIAYFELSNDGEPTNRDGFPDGYL